MLFWEPILWNSNAANLYIEHQILNIGALICLGYLIFFIGIFGLVYYRFSLLYFLISVEVMLVGLNFSTLFIGALLHQPFCQIFVLMLLTLAAAETALGLSLVLLYYKLYKTTSIQVLTKLRF
jgi:NADH-quinone oxidoreductase subunit K